MSVQVSYPGVYVQEVSSGVRTITGVSTSIALFVGMTHQGPLREATRVLSFADYERTFGTDPSAGEMPDQLRQFFLNGGQQAYIMRIADGAEEAQVDLLDEAGGGEVLRLEAVSAGRLGETLRVMVDYNTASPESTFNLTVVREETDGSGVVQAAETEIFDNLTQNPESPNYVVSRVNLGSNLVRAEAAQPMPLPIPGYSLAGVLMSGVFDQLQTIFDALPDPDGSGNFQISVDNSPFVPVRITRPTSIAPEDVNTAILAPILTALAPYNRTVTVATPTIGGLTALQITSAQAGGNVRIVPAQSRDIAVAMQMGVAQGGLEVDGYAPLRPAPSGFFSVLGSGGQLEDFSIFLAADADSFNVLNVNDVGAGTVEALATGWPGNASTFSTGTLTGPQTNSLLNARQNLNFLVTRINASDLEWTASLQGYRVVLIPDFGGANGGLGANIVSSPNSAFSDLFGLANVSRYRLGDFTNTHGPYQFGEQAGSNGAFPRLEQYQEAYGIVDRQVDLFNLMVLPRAVDQQDVDRLALWGPSSVFAQRRRAFLIVDPRDGLVWRDVNDVTDGTVGIDNLRLGLVQDHAAVYWPRLRIAAPEGGERVIDPAGTVAGLMARTDANRGVWKAPAGLEASLRGVRGVQHPMSDPENGVINPRAVNAVRVFPNGVVSWGARTLAGFDNSGNDDYKYVPVRRLALFLEESLYRGLRFAVFEPNDEPLWGQLRLAAGAFMNNLFRQGAFQGSKSSDAYFVKVDSETTTQNDINLGIVNVVVGFAPLKPAEFVVITLRQIAGQVQV